jgi:integrase
MLPKCYQNEAAIRKPWFKSQSGTWVINLPGGRVRTLGKDLHGATRKNPPPHIVEIWHNLDRQRKPKDMLFCEIADGYIASQKNPKTAKSGREQIDWFLAHVGRKIKVSALRVNDVTSYLKTKDWSENMKATAVSKITAALNWGVAEGLIEDHKVKFARGKKPRFQRRTGQITPNDQRALESACHPALRTMLVALRESGCRPKELCEARIEKVDLAARVMMVPNKVGDKTGEKERPIYLSSALAAIIRESIGTRTAGFVFLNSYGDPWKTQAISHRVRKVRIKLGLPDTVVAYNYRHAFASSAINDSNANPAHVARLLGHSDLTMLLKTYFHESPEAMLKAIEEITKKNPA